MAEENRRTTKAGKEKWTARHAEMWKFLKFLFAGGAQQDF